MNAIQRLHAQRGAFSILSAFTLVMAILFLALVVDSGRLYLEQRNLQKLADTAALESISRLASGNCSLDAANAVAYAAQNAATYGFVGNDEQSLATDCVSIATENNLRKPSADPSNGRAVRVITSKQVPSSIIVRTGGLFGISGSATIRLQAIAVAQKDSDPLAVFSVGAQLLDLNSGGLLPRLLTGVGVNVNGLTLLDSQGLANAQITPAGLLQALGVNVGINQLRALSPEGLVQLVDTQVGAIGINRLLDVSAQLVTQNQTLAAEITALGNRLVGSQIQNATVNLLATDSRPGLLKLVTGPGQTLGSALDAQLSLGDVLSTGLMTAVQGRGLALDQLNLLNGTLAVRVGVVEPPSIGIGPVGTTAFNAQTRLQLDVNTSNLPVLGSLLNFLGTSIRLPLILDLASAKGELTEIDCTKASPDATIEVESTIGNVCIGEMSASTLWSTRNSCTEANIQNTPILKLLGADIISGKAAVPLLSTGSSPVHDDVVTLAEDESAITGINGLSLGTSTKSLVSKVLEMIRLGVPRSSDGSPGFTLQQATLIADRYLDSLSYSKTAVRDRMFSDGLKWTRPAGLGDTTMPAEWFAKQPSSCGTAAQRTTCRNTLIDSLQSKAQGGLLTSVVGGLLGLVGDLVNTLTLGLLGLSTDGQPLLLKILDPILGLLEPLLNSVGSALSDLLTSLGLELGKSEIKVHSITCGIPHLVR